MTNTIFRKVFSFLLVISVPCFAGSDASLNQHKVKMLDAYQKADPKVGSQTIDPKTLSEIQSGLEDQLKKTCFEVLKDPNKYDSKTLAECKKRESAIQKATTNPKRASLQCTIPLPYKQQGCEGECCGLVLDPLTAEQTQSLYELPSIKSKVIGGITKGEELKESELLLITTQLGEVKVTSENYKVIELGLKKGDVVKTLAYGSEGSYIVCLGKSENGDLGWEGELKAIREAKVEQWTKVTKKNGLTGYVQGIGYKQRKGCG